VWNNVIITPAYFVLSSATKKVKFYNAKTRPTAPVQGSMFVRRDPTSRRTSTSPTPPNRASATKTARFRRTRPSRFFFPESSPPDSDSGSSTWPSPRCRCHKTFCPQFTNFRNKIECLLLATLSSLVLCLLTQVEQPTNIRLGLKGLLMTIILAYYVSQ